MARGSLERTQRYCKTCQWNMPSSRNSTVWGLGDFVMILFTFGGWLVAKFAFNFLMNGWRCERCGSRV